MSPPNPTQHDSSPGESCPTIAAAYPESRLQALVEVAVIVALLVVYAGGTPPAVNEAHYLSKARHYWDPNWCPNDLFLDSADAHWTFYWTVGWLANVLPLPLAAWCGRLVAWTLLAWGWQRLSVAVIPRAWFSIFSILLWLAFIDYGAMAGEWVVGGIEAKCLAYPLVLFALADLQRGRWSRAIVLLGGATAFHVLVGGWSLVAVGVAWLSCGAFRPRWLTLIPAAVGAGVLALPGLIPALRLTANQDPVIVLEANWIYVFGRLSHHLVFHLLPRVDVACHVLLLVLWLVVGWLTPCHPRAGNLGQRPLRGFVGGAVLLAVIGAVLDQALLEQWELSVTFLKYYWFRLSDAMLPAGAALAITAAITRWWATRPSAARSLAFITVVIAAVNFAAETLDHGLLSPRRDDLQIARLGEIGLLPADEVSQVAQDWLATCRWIAAHTPRDAQFLTPRNQMTFKWYAERAEAVSVKDIPQDARSVVAWQLRREQLFPPDTGLNGISVLGEQRLAELAREFHANYLVADEFLGGPRLRWPRVYPLASEASSSFAVYRVPAAE